MTHYYLSPYVGSGTEEDSFRPLILGDEWHAIDLRPDCSRQDGVALVALPVRVDETATAADYLGDDLDGTWPAAVRRRAGNRLSLTPGASKLRRLFPELLIDHAREDGSRWRPLRPTRRGRYEIHLAGLVWEMPLVSGGAIVSDDFNRADSSNLGANWTEVSGDLNIVTNALQTVALATDSRARYESDLATDDHYAQCEQIALNRTGAGAGLRMIANTRFDPAADTHYRWKRTYATGAGNDGCQLQKVVAGTISDVVASTTVSGATPETIRAEIDGSTYRGLIAGVEAQSATDTSITGNLRAGIGLLLAGTSAVDRLRVDNFEAGDLAAAATKASDGIRSVQQAVNRGAVI